MEVAGLLLTNAALAALLAVAAFAASRLVRRPAVLHGLWLLALVKLVTPPLVELPVLPSFARGGATDLAWPRSAIDTAALPPSARRFRAPGADTALRARPVVSSGFPASRQAEPAGASRAVLPAVLALGAACFGILTTVRFSRFRSLVAGARSAPPGVAGRAAELGAGLGLRRVPPVLVVSARIPPMIWPTPAGPRLLLPRDLLPELLPEELDALLVHELAHVRRRDHWVRLVEVVATALFWWYPVTWWVRRALRRAEERCCDEWVLRALPSSARAYADGILKSLALLAEDPVPLPTTASGAGPIADLEARLKEILMTRPLPRLPFPVRTLLCGVALAGLVVFPTVARPRSARAAALTPLPDATLEAPPAGAAQGSTPAPGAPTILRSPARPPAAPPAPISEASPRAGQPTLAPAAPDEEVEDPALAAERRDLEERRRQLRLAEIDLERRSLQLEARARQREMAAESARRKADGDAEAAARAEKMHALHSRRVDLERTQLDLQVRQVGLEAEAARAEERAAAAQVSPEEKARALEAAERALDHKRQALEAETRQLEARVEAMDAEMRVHELRGATDELARSLSEQLASLREALPEAGAQRAELEREIERLEAALGALHGGRSPKGAARTSTPPAK